MKKRSTCSGFMTLGRSFSSFKLNSGLTVTLSPEKVLKKVTLATLNKKVTLAALNIKVTLATLNKKVTLATLNKKVTLATVNLHSLR